MTSIAITDGIDKPQFQAIDRKNQYVVKSYVRGSITDHPYSIALVLEEVGPLYLVMRDGKKMQVSQIKEGDVPRDPDKHGL